MTTTVLTKTNTSINTNTNTNTNTSTSCGIKHWFSLLGSIAFAMILFLYPVINHMNTTYQNVINNGTKTSSSSSLSTTSFATNIIIFNNNNNNKNNPNTDNNDDKNDSIHATKEKEEETIIQEVVPVQAEQEYIDDSIYSTNIQPELFHVQHPATGKYIISRYGINYTNRIQRFPSIEQRIMLYMSNWYLPACHRYDISAIRYYSYSYNTSYNSTNQNDDDQQSRYLKSKKSSTSTKKVSDNNDTTKSTKSTTNINTTLPIQYITVSSFNHTSTMTSTTNNTQNTTTKMSKSNINKNMIHWEFNNIVQADAVFYITEHNINVAVTNITNQLVSSYSVDVQDLIIPTMKRLQLLDDNDNDNDNDSNDDNTTSRRKQKKKYTKIPIPPIFIEYGDRTHCLYHPNELHNVNNIPTLKKIRTAITSDEQRYRIAVHGQTLIKKSSSTTASVGSSSIDDSSIDDTDTTPTNSSSTSEINKITTCTSSVRIYPTNSVIDTVQPIIWKLNTGRHYRKITSGEMNKVDILPYEKKHNVAIFRGAMTGHGVTEQWISYYNQSNTTSTSTDSNETTITSISDFEICYNIPRCKLVMMYSNTTSSTIDVKLTGTGVVREPHPSSISVPIEYNSTNNFIVPTNIQSMNGTIINKPIKIVQLMDEKLHLKYLVNYKIIILLEGNDVSSGLKWAMYSKCVVIMPYPVTSTSWAMEELLEPYIHFVPIYQNLTNLQQQVTWILNNEKEAKYISYRASLWIYDLLNFPNDDIQIQNEILTRYNANFFYFNKIKYDV